jgi:Tol biopolymer transport system component
LSPDGRTIAFQSTQGGQDWEIYVVNATGRPNRRQLTNNRHGIQDTDPRWSPDSRTILFVTNRDGNDEIYAMNADGSRKRNLTRNSADDDSPAWAP